MIPLIEKLAFHSAYVKISSTNNCGKQQRKVFNRIRSKKDVKTGRHFSEIFTATCFNRNKSECYGSNQSVSIEGISVDSIFEGKNVSKIIPSRLKVVS